MNKQIKETENQIDNLNGHLQFLNEQARKRLEILAKQDGPYSKIDGQIIQLTQRVADHQNFLKTIKELLGVTEDGESESEPEPSINPEKL